MHSKEDHAEPKELMLGDKLFKRLSAAAIERYIHFNVIACPISNNYCFIDTQPRLSSTNNIEH